MLTRWVEWVSLSLLVLLLLKLPLSLTNLLAVMFFFEVLISIVMDLDVSKKNCFCLDGNRPNMG